MPNIFATAMSAVTILMLAIVAFQYRTDSLAAAGLTGNDAEAFNLTREATSDVMVISGNAFPLLLTIILLVFVIVMLLLTR